MTFSASAEAFSSSAVTSLAANASMTVAVGDLVYVVAFSESSPSNTHSFADSLGNTYTQIVNLPDPGNARTFSQHYSKITVAGSALITMTIGSSQPARFGAASYTGIAGSLLDHQETIFTSDPGTGTDAVVVTALTVSSQPAWVFGATENGYGPSLTAGTGFAGDFAPSSWPADGTAGLFESQRVTSTSPISATFTLGATGTGHMVGVSAVFAEGAPTPSVGKAFRYKGVKTTSASSRNGLGKYSNRLNTSNPFTPKQGKNVPPIFVEQFFDDSSGVVSHPSTGALAAQSATVTGTAAHLTLHPSSGALAAQAATLAGTANRTRLHPSTGSLAADAAAITGAAARTRVHPSTGALVADAALVNGTAARTRVHPSTGALIADAALISGTANRTALHPSSGSLVADAAVIAGTAAHLTLHTTTGDLIAGDAVIAGTADHTVPGGSHSTDGTLIAQEAQVSGTAARFAVHPSTGALAADPALVSGTATHLTVHTATGALVAQEATINGTAQGPSPVQTRYYGGGDDVDEIPKRDKKQKQFDDLLTNVADSVLTPKVVSVKRALPPLVKPALREKLAQALTKPLPSIVEIAPIEVKPVVVEKPEEPDELPVILLLLLS